MYNESFSVIEKEKLEEVKKLYSEKEKELRILIGRLANNDEALYKALISHLDQNFVKPLSFLKDLKEYPTCKIYFVGDDSFMYSLEKRNTSRPNITFLKLGTQELLSALDSTYPESIIVYGVDVSLGTVNQENPMHVLKRRFKEKSNKILFVLNGVGKMLMNILSESTYDPQGTDYTCQTLNSILNNDFTDIIVKDFPQAQIAVYDSSRTCKGYTFRFLDGHIEFRSPLEDRLDNYSVIDDFDNVQKTFEKIVKSNRLNYTGLVEYLLLDHSNFTTKVLNTHVAQSGHMDLLLTDLKNLIDEQKWNCTNSVREFFISTTGGITKITEGAIDEFNANDNFRTTLGEDYIRDLLGFVEKKINQGVQEELFRLCKESLERVEEGIRMKMDETFPLHESKKQPIEGCFKLTRELIDFDLSSNRECIAKGAAGVGIVVASSLYLLGPVFLVVPSFLISLLIVPVFRWTTRSSIRKLMIEEVRKVAFNLVGQSSDIPKSIQAPFNILKTDVSDLIEKRRRLFLSNRYDLQKIGL